MTGTPANTASHSDIPTLIELLKRQQTLYEQLQQMGDEQSALVADGRTEPLIALLGRRQIVIDQIAGLNRSLEPYRADWDELLDTLSAEQRATVTSLVNDVQSLLARIMEQDDRDRAALQDAQSRVGGELKKVNRGNQAAAAYKTSSQSVSKAMNKQG